jgi:hypothetical protein
MIPDYQPVADLLEATEGIDRLEWPQTKNPGQRSVK